MKTIKIFIILTILFLISCNSSIVDDPAISISFLVPEDSQVKLIVINSYNTIIAILVDQDLAAGTYQVSFDASNLAEGIYFYTLELTGESGSYSKLTKHMLLIK
jgi:hypothetical protein